MINRDGLENKLKNFWMEHIFDSNFINNYYKEIESKYKIPATFTWDFVNFNKDLGELNEFFLFAFADCAGSFKLSSYFTEKEIKELPSFNYKEEKTEFPMVFKAIEIVPGHWLTKITARELMLLRKAQKINYDETTQRTKRKVVKHGEVFYHISLNNAAVKSIKNLLLNGYYIEDDLTFNIAEKTSCDYSFNKDKCELIIYDIDKFDLLDGYHRFVSICKAGDDDESFDCTMELRFVDFDDEKCHQFIYQKDQKTKMNQSDSDSFNINDAANIVVEKLNTSPKSAVRGMIGRNKANINAAALSTAIRFLMVNKRAKGVEERRMISSLSKELIEDFNILFDENGDMYEKEFSVSEINTIIYMFYLYMGKDKSNLSDDTLKLLNASSKMSQTRFGYPVKKLLEGMVAECSITI